MLLCVALHNFASLKRTFHDLDSYYTTPLPLTYAQTRKPEQATIISSHNLTHRIKLPFTVCSVTDNRGLS